MNTDEFEKFSNEKLNEILTEIVKPKKEEKTAGGIYLPETDEKILF